MKKLVLMFICIIFLSACYKKQDNNIYTKMIEELNGVNKTSEDMPLSVEIEIEKLNDSLYRYSALINKNEEIMKDVNALIIHNKESENAFPSVGIFDEKVNVGEEKGIKLTGYVENVENIEFKLFIDYVNKENNEVKYYYVEDISTINVNFND